MIEINMNLVYTIINVIILYLLLRHFLIKPVTDIMEKRKHLIADGLQSAQDAQDAGDAESHPPLALIPETKREPEGSLFCMIRVVGRL